jgi:hypothetical protein
VLDTAPVEAVPLVALLPLQPPDAVQEVALVEDQVRVADPPDAMEAGLTLRLTGGLVPTVRVVEALVLP